MIAGRKFLFLLLTLFLVVLASGCTKNEVKLTFDISGNITEPCRIVYYISDKKGGLLRETIVEITGGKAEFILPQRNPAIFYLFGPSQKNAGAIFYAKKGDRILVSGKEDKPDTWTLSGNKITEELSDWRLKNLDAIRSEDPAKINRAVKDYVISNPKSKAAVIILYVYYNRKDDETGFISLQAKIDKELLEDSSLMDALSASDLFTGLEETPTYPKQLIFNGASGHADTISVFSGNGSLLIFRKNNDNSRFIPSDTINSLLAGRKDKKVAEFFLERDSSAWRRHIGSDTVPGYHRLWMPLGLADNAAISMGVRRIPFYIVIGKGGKEIYRGDSWEEASNEFEKL